MNKMNKSSVLNVKTVWLVIVSIVTLVLTGCSPQSQEQLLEEDHALIDVAINVNTEVKEDLKNQVTIARQVLETEEDVKKLYDAYMTLGSVYNKLEEYDRAIDIYKEAIKTIPPDIQLFTNLGTMYDKNGKYKEAEEAYLDALEIGAEPQTIIKLGELYRYRLNKPKEEIKRFYEDSIARALVLTNIIKEYASYLEEIGDLEEALSWWEELAASDPEDEAIKEKIAELKAELGVE